MREHGGSVVNITSIGGISPAPNTGYYNATKAALGFLTRQLAAELAPAVRVNTVAPGMIDTDMAAAIPAAQRTHCWPNPPGPIRLARRHSRRDIVPAIGGAGWITGQVLAVDGGALDPKGVLLS